MCWQIRDKVWIYLFHVFSSECKIVLQTQILAAGRAQVNLNCYVCETDYEIFTMTSVTEIVIEAE